MIISDYRFPILLERIALPAMVATLIVIGAAQRVRAAEAHRHPPQDAAIHETFYSTWMRPDDRARSCCGKEDCYPVEAKKVGGTWFFKRRETGEWTPVPPEKIEYERDNPDGRNHVCDTGAYTYCFILGGGT